jgi:1,4-alpha-glucan branching enzyme
MTREEIEAIVGGYNGDAFRILGPHVTDRKKACWEVRAFLPQAEEAAVIIDGDSRPMKKVHATGFYVASIDGDPKPYRLWARLWGGGMVEFDDPYRFPLLLSDFELHLFSEGTHYESYRSLGAHAAEVDGVQGVRFAVWAPNAEVVAVVGDFNDWDVRRHPMRLRNVGIWEIFIPGLGNGSTYKYFVRSRFHGYQQLKIDPYAFYCETSRLLSCCIRRIKTTVHVRNVNWCRAT